MINIQFINTFLTDLLIYNYLRFIGFWGVLGGCFLEHVWEMRHVLSCSLSNREYCWVVVNTSLDGGGAKKIMVNRLMPLKKK